MPGGTICLRGVGGGNVGSPRGRKGAVAVPEASKAARIVHNLGLATWFGGSLFGQIALNPAVKQVSDRSERGKVLNVAWGYYNAINAVALLATLLTWRVGGLKADGELRAPVLVRVKDLLLGGAAVNAIASDILGATIARQASGGATPV